MTASSRRIQKNRPVNESAIGKKDFSKFGGIKVQALVVIAFLCATISVIALFSSSKTSEPTPFAEYISKSACEVESPTPQDDFLCRMADCTFDTSICSSGCPFGFSTDDSGCPNECSCAESGIMEGDIMFNENALPSMIENYGFSSAEEDFATFSGSGVATDNRLWKFDIVDGIHYIGYEFDPNVVYSTKERLREAMDFFRAKTCIRFKEVELRQYNKKGVLFSHDEQFCVGEVGTYSMEDKDTEAFVSPTCTLVKMKHQLMHLVGFYHEHSRPDRDAYINVYWQNVYRRYATYLVKRRDWEVRNLNSEYDERSLLHYHEKTYSRNSQPTVMSRKGKQLGSLDFSEEDIFEINALYGCKVAKNPTSSLLKWTQWTSWSNCDVTCAVGKRVRYRKCRDKTGSDASGCEGSGTDKLPCNAPSACQSLWSQWSSRGPCSRTCGSGWIVRFRRCLGTGCPGNGFEVTRCQIQSCKRDGMWALWSDWQRCSATCGSTSVVRIRLCKNIHGGISRTCGSGDSKVSREQQRRSCGLPSCESLLAWGPWSPCSGTCLGSRKRKCNGKACATEYQTEGCNTRSCSVPDIFKKNREKLNVDSVCNAALNMDNWILGDFNGDSRMDVICLDQYKVYHLTYGSRSGFDSVWSGSFENCNADGIVLQGDINKDGKLDLICNSQDEGRLYVKYASHRSFTDGVTEGGDFCTDYLSRLSTVTYSKTTGLLCHYENNKVELIFTKD